MIFEVFGEFDFINKQKRERGFRPSPYPFLLPSLLSPFSNFRPPYGLRERKKGGLPERKRCEFCVVEILPLFFHLPPPLSPLASLPHPWTVHSCCPLFYNSSSCFVFSLSPSPSISKCCKNWPPSHPFSKSSSHSRKSQMKIKF